MGEEGFVEIWGQKIPDIFLVTLAVMAFLTFLSWLATRKLRYENPGLLQNLMESVVEFLLNLIKESAGEHAWEGFKYIATFFLFILTANMIGLANIRHVKSPTADLTFTLGLASSVLILTIYFGIKTKGLKGYLHHFIEPYWPFFPLKIFELFIRPISMALRLFGNIFAGEMMLVVLTLLVPFLIWIWQGFSIFIGVIQAYLFALLALAYISETNEQ